MKKIGMSLAMGALVLVLAHCSPKTAKVEEIVASMDKAYVSSHFKAEKLEEGKVLYTNNCGKCHKLFAPEKLTVAKWNIEVDHMLPKTRLTPQEGQLVRAYVVANAK